MLKSLPESFSQLTKLERLDIGDNNIDELVSNRLFALSIGKSCSKKRRKEKPQNAFAPPHFSVRDLKKVYPDVFSFKHKKYF